MGISGGIVEYAAPAQTLTFAAGGSISGGDLVSLSDNMTVVVASAGSLTAIGVALHDAASGDKVTVACEGVYYVTASGAVTQGQRVECAANGNVRALQTTDTTGSLDPRAIVGIALEDIADTATGRVRLSI